MASQFDEQDNKSSEILRKYYSDLYSARFPPYDVAVKLYSEKVITDNEFEELESPSLDVKSKRMTVLRSVRYRIRGNHLLLRKFATILISFDSLRETAYRMLKEFDQCYSTKQNIFSPIPADYSESQHEMDTSMEMSAQSSLSLGEANVSIHLKSTYKPSFNKMRGMFGHLRVKSIGIISSCPRVKVDELKMLMSGFGELESLLTNPSTVKDAMIIIVRMCTLLDTNFIEVIVDCYNISEMGSLITDYKDSLEKFCDQITVDICCEQSFDFEIPGEQLVCDTVEFILEWNAGDHMLSDIKLLLEKAFDIMARRVKVVSVKDTHSVLITCYAHNSVQSLLVVKAQSNLLTLRDYGLKKLTIGHVLVWDGYCRDEELEILQKDNKMLKSKLNEVPCYSEESVGEEICSDCQQCELLSDKDLKKRLKMVTDLYTTVKTECDMKELKIHELTERVEGINSVGKSMLSPVSSRPISRSCSNTSNDEDIPDWIVQSAQYITCDDVLKFLKSLPLEEYTAVFEENSIDGPRLMQMIHGDDTTLPKLVHDLGHQTLIETKFVEFVERESGIEWGADYVMMTSPTQDQCKAVMGHVKRNQMVSVYLWSCSSLSTEEVFSSVFDTLVSRLRLYSSEVHMESLIDVLKTHPTLHELRLWSCNLQVENVRLISESIINEARLIDLNLHHNPDISDDGVKHIAALLMSNECIERLDISDCNISDIGVEYLADSLKSNKTLQSLSLSHNIGITTTGTKFIGDMLTVNRSLKDLHLSRTSVGIEGIHILSQALAKNNRISRLVLPTQLREYYMSSNISTKGRIFF